jgi:IclR family transcriptional regulator, pca regulon regulatory protein
MQRSPMKHDLRRRKPDARQPAHPARALSKRAENSAASEANGTKDKEFMLTLAKGLAVLNAFGRDRPTMTLSQAAQSVDLSRATARRVLHTLVKLGYVEQNDRQFALSPRIMQLGFAYVSSQSWIDRAAPLMKALSERFGESCSAAILEGVEIIYVARIPARRIMSAALSVGSRLPALHSSMGRIQLGFLDEAEIWRRLKSARIEPLTPATITDLQALYERIRDDHRQGFSIVDEELERGLRSIAVPIADRDGQCIGAINLSTHSTRTTRNELRETFLPELKAVAAQVSALVF